MCERLAGAVPVTVADLLVGEASNLRFIALDRRFGVLDGSRFPRLGDAERAASRVARLVMGEPLPRPMPAAMR